MTWKRTGEPAHNNAERRSAEDQPTYEANPQCSICGGTGDVVMERPLRNYEGEAVDVEIYMQPCDCVFVKWRVKPDTDCKQCCGVGAVQERMIVNEEEAIFFYDCVCLRYVQGDENEETRGDSH